MNLTLTRKTYGLYGIVGELKDEAGKLNLFSLEHAYLEGTLYVPKVAPGTYTCLRHPPARLNYETFELQNVPNFQGNPVTGILIHRGNYNGDSEGCILVGAQLGQGCILESQVAFDQLMGMLEGVDSFTLTIA